MLRLNVIALALITLAGCGADNRSPAEGGASQRSTTQAPTVTELAAYAASRHFPPDSAPRSNLHTASIVNRGTGIIKIYNFDATPIRNVDVWVNQAFVLRVPALPANGSVEVKMVDMYNAVGRNLATQNEPIRQVQLVSDGTLNTTWGPASE